MATIAFATAGCGARWTDEQRAAVIDAHSGSGSTASAGVTGASGSTATNTGATATGATSSGSAGTGSSSSGTGASSPAGGADPAATQTAAPSSLPCSAPSDAPGVSDTEIAIGNVNTLSGAVPGLGASAAAAAQAYVAYRNSIGGVCGRQIVLRQGDDGLDSGRSRALFSEMEPNIIGMIGGNGTGSGGGAEIVNAAGIPVVGMGSSPQMDDARTFYPTNPLDLRDVATPKYRWLYDQGVRRAAVVYVSAAVSANEGQRQITLMRASGIEIVLESALPLSTLSFDSAARAVANSGADYLFFVHADGSSASMAQAMNDTGYTGLKFEDYVVAYGSNFIDLGGSAAEGASSWTFALPSEDPPTVPEHAAFLEWMAQVAPDASVDTFAALAWAGGKGLLDAMEALPGPITREAIVAQLDATGTFDAGGLIAPVQLGAKHSSGCQIAMIVQGGAWTRLAPAQGFLC